MTHIKDLARRLCRVDTAAHFGLGVEDKEDTGTVRMNPNQQVLAAQIWVVMPDQVGRRRGLAENLEHLHSIGMQGGANRTCI